MLSAPARQIPLSYRRIKLDYARAAKAANNDTANENFIMNLEMYKLKCE